MDFHWDLLDLKMGDDYMPNLVFAAHMYPFPWGPSTIASSNAHPRLAYFHPPILVCKMESALMPQNENAPKWTQTIEKGRKMER